MNRYYQDFTGKWVFRVGADTVDNMWEPLESVEITDALACSRNELGPVYVVDGYHLGKLVYVDGMVMQLVAVQYYTSRHPIEVHGSGPFSVIPFRIATPDELSAAGLWDD